ncbi:MAG: MgtC/SapB family protein [Cyclobacteriaceae bacterium]|nr:MgtC/SapB family protein [Cyclobacteriaceae bacterium]
MGGGSDRIASTIVTGIGFLGAGVIFKDGLTVTGLTTATTIWISAALGMAVGAGEYFISIVGSGVVLVVLILFEKLQGQIERWHQARVYKISYKMIDDFDDALEHELDKLKVGYKRKREYKQEGTSVLVYEVFGREKRLERFNEFLLQSRNVIAFEY